MVQQNHTKIIMLSRNCLTSAIIRNGFLTVKSHSKAAVTFAGRSEDPAGHMAKGAWPVTERACAGCEESAERNRGTFLRRGAWLQQNKWNARNEQWPEQHHPATAQKGAEPMSDNENTAMQENCQTVIKTIGKTTYIVDLHYSETGTENFSEKFKRVLREQSAWFYGKMFRKPLTSSNRADNYKLFQAVFAVAMMISADRFIAVAKQPDAAMRKSRFDTSR